jgi:hypothetical protein
MPMYKKQPCKDAAWTANTRTISRTPRIDVSALEDVRITVDHKDSFHHRSAISGHYHSLTY